MQANYTFLPPLLSHERMYASHYLYNELIAFLETNGLGWTSDLCSAVGKRFVDGMSKGLFLCGPPVWNALNNKHNNGKASVFYFSYFIYTVLLRSCLGTGCPFLRDIALLPFFKNGETASKNEGSKRGNIAIANKCIANVVADMDLWIGKDS